MNHRIIESIITTQNGDGSPHIAPMGVWQQQDHYVLAPFRPSRTLDNIARSGTAVINFTDQVKIFAGCLTNHFDWAVLPAVKINGIRLAAAQTHIELKKTDVLDDETRPQFHCEVMHKEMHAPFRGYNRAQFAVIELAILVSRLQRIPADKIDNELAWLSIAINKTAGNDEREAWGWLMEKLNKHRQATQSAPI